ncbi:glycosyltransferase [Candidatus Babeliales bacterium]|nr:glycosyltransferase [Candidatus Babeliales bacterium]
MRVLHFITSLEVGGAQRVLLERLNQFVKNGECLADHYIVYLRDGAFRKQIEAAGFKTKNIMGASWKASISVFRLIFLIKQFKPEVIHSSLWLANLIARWCGWVCHVPVICDMHANFSHHGALRNFIDRLPHPLPKKFVAVAGGVAQSFRKNITEKMWHSRLGKKAWSRCCVIENGIDPTPFVFSQENRKRVRKRLGIEDATFVVGAVGRLVSVKRYDVLIDAFKVLCRKYEKSRLLIVGDGPLRPELERQSRVGLLQEKISFLGHRSDVADLYSAFDCLAICSQSEGLSIAYLEALVSGVPIIVSSADVEVLVKKMVFYFLIYNQKKFFARKAKLFSQNMITYGAGEFHKLYDEILQD